MKVTKMGNSYERTPDGKWKINGELFNPSISALMEVAYQQGKKRRMNDRKRPPA
jgi:hypothetical protein